MEPTFGGWLVEKLSKHPGKEEPVKEKKILLREGWLIAGDFGVTPWVENRIVITRLGKMEAAGGFDKSNGTKWSRKEYSG